MMKNSQINLIQLDFHAAYEPSFKPSMAAKTTPVTPYVTFFLKFRFFVELFSADKELWSLRKEIQKLSLQLYGSW